MHVLLDLLALSLLNPWRWREAAQSMRAGVSAADVLARQVSLASGSETVESLRARAARALESGREHGLTPVGWSESAYPAALAAISDPPFIIWTRGAVDALQRISVAIVGARAATPYGCSVAFALARDLAAHGVVVVSGLARGVDAAAHRGALHGGGMTVAVLGCGPDRVYPRVHTSLAHDIADGPIPGAVISELAPGTHPLPHFFPLRNRIISGLSRAVVVIEAGEKSGSLITARAALEQGRDVLAVPGNVLSGQNRGSHSLLRDGAKIVESADDILEELGLPETARARERPGRACSDPVLACLPPGEPVDLDAISAETGLTSSRLLTRLFELELAGRVKRAGGGKFVRVDISC